MIKTILEFWFGTANDDAEVARQQEALWWKKQPEADEAIRARFAASVEKAARGELADWQASGRGRLALILLTDQFPRNIYRGTPRAFSHDTLARACCLDGLSAGVDRELRLIERVFFYLPLEHSESREHQARSVELFGELLAAAPPTQRRLFEGYLNYAVAHRNIVDRFGRFPHRNALLGRTSTPEEIAFLATPGSSF